MNALTNTQLDSVEQTLARIWCEVILLPEVGREENFFDIGGHSLLAAQVMARIGKTFGVELPLRIIFESPTIAELAEVVRCAQRERPGESVAIVPGLDEGTAHKLLERLDQFSEEELRELLEDPKLKELLS